MWPVLREPKCLIVPEISSLNKILLSWIFIKLLTFLNYMNAVIEEMIFPVFQESGKRVIREPEWEKSSRSARAGTRRPFAREMIFRRYRSPMSLTFIVSSVCIVSEYFQVCPENCLTSRLLWKYELPAWCVYFLNTIVSSLQCNTVFQSETNLHWYLCRALCACFEYAFLHRLCDCRCNLLHDWVENWLWK